MSILPDSVLIDSDILIKLFRQGEERYLKKILKFHKNDTELYISTITVFEYLCGYSLGKVSSNEKYINLMQIIGKFRIQAVNFDSNVAQVCSNIFDMLKKKDGDIKGRELDFLIAGTAIFKKCPMWTDNTRDMKDIPMLKIV